MEEEFERAISFEELYKGLNKSSRNVKWKDSVATYYGNALRNTYKLRQDLLNGKYTIVDLRSKNPKSEKLLLLESKIGNFNAVYVTTFSTLSLRAASYETTALVSGTRVWTTLSTDWTHICIAIIVIMAPRDGC